MPDELEKLQGEDKVAMQRVIITYYEQDSEALKNLLGLEQIDKVVYNLKELLK